MRKKFLSILLIGTLFICLIGCGKNKDIINNNNNSTINIDNKEKDVVDASKTLQNDTISQDGLKYVDADDTDEYFILYDDNTFDAHVNFCAGYRDIEGTYEIEYSNHLTGRAADVLTMYYSDGTKDIFDVTKYSEEKITNLTIDNRNSDLIFGACGGTDFYLVEEE